MKKFNLRYTGVAMSIMAMTAIVSANTANAQEATEEIVVTGTRATIQTAIDQKRISTEIVDGLSADEIGDIPALSIGEALETITGVSANRENGGAADISIRGLGPFLVNTVINGREVTNGSGNRSVNFGIFPSELFNKIGIFKTQSADFIEGAVGGQIRLETKSPIEHGKQSIQLNAKAAFAENERDIDGGQDVGYRGTISYIDQFETENFGTFGISVGAQIRDEASPEQEFRTSGTLRVCELDTDGTLLLDGGLDSTTDRCDDQRPGRDGNTIDRSDPNEVGNPFALVPGSLTYRQNESDDERNAFFTAVEWQPNERLTILADFQFSSRDQEETRNDLVLTSTATTILNAGTNLRFDGDDSGGIGNLELGTSTNGEDVGTNADGDPLTAGDFVGFLPFQADANGVTQQLTTVSDIENQVTDFERDEDFTGIGLNIEYQVNDNLVVSGDIGYSNTERVEQEARLSFGSDARVLTAIDFRSTVPDVTFLGQPLVTNDGDIIDPTFNPTDPNSLNFGAAGAPAAGFDGNNFDYDEQVDTRENTIFAVRGDFDLQTENLGIIKSVEGGVRFQTLDFDSFGNINDSLNDSDLGGAEVFNSIAANCFDDIPEDGFLDALLPGDRSLFSDSSGNEFDTFTTLDLGCALGTEGFDLSSLDLIDGRTTESSDIDEETFSAYLKANFETTIAGFPARGNFGVRLVNTRVESAAFRGNFTFDIDDRDNVDDIPESFLSLSLDQDSVGVDRVESGSFTEILPSATLILDLSDNVLLRTGVFRGLSRINPTTLSLGIDVFTDAVEINIADDAVGATQAEIDSAIGSALSLTEASGNPQLEPLTSWNADLALEWYPNKDTILAAGVYYKQFVGGFESTTRNETFNIAADGSDDFQDFVGIVPTLQTTDDSSNLYGIELTASHAFSYLPGFLSGFGGKISYNYASTDFEFEDDVAGEGSTFDPDTGETIGLTGIIPPTELFGFSRNVASAQLYWNRGAFDAQLIFKHRSSFFQQFTNDPGRIRTIDDSNVLEFRASYKLNDSIRLSFEGLNITDEGRTDFRAVEGNINQAVTFGPRYFFGIRAKL